MSELIVSNLGHLWILDIDGTVVKHNGYKIDGVDSLLPGVKEFFASLPCEDMVIFITSRKAEYKQLTESFLKENNIRFDYIIYNAPFGERIVVNDNKPSGLKMSKAICLVRDKGLKFDLIINDEL